MMSIVVIQGPHHVDSESVAIRSLRAKAGAAGKQLLVRTGATLQELIECLRQSRAPDTEFVLLDSGELDPRECGSNAAELRLALERLPSPYIEMHDGSGQVLDQYVRPDHAPLVTVVINHDRPASYSLAFAIALRRLQAPGRATGHALSA